MTYKAAFDQKRGFGLEIELSRADRYELLYALNQSGFETKIGLHEEPNISQWTLTEDSTLEGEDPVELKSPILRGTDGLLAVKSVLNILNYLECQTNSSCGLHVHQYAADFTGANVLALLRLYSKFEVVIDGLVDVSRREDKNTHCRSLAKDNNLAWISELDKTGHSRAIETVLNFNNAYKTRQSKVNILSYLKHLTIEFRHFESTTDADEAINWIVFTQLLVNKSKSSTVSKEMSAKPVLGELLRVLGLVEYQESKDPLAVSCRTWMKAKYATVRGKKKELVTA